MVFTPATGLTQNKLFVAIWQKEKKNLPLVPIEAFFPPCQIEADEPVPDQEYSEGPELNALLPFYGPSLDLDPIAAILGGKEKIQLYTFETPVWTV